MTLTCELIGTDNITWSKHYTEANTRQTDCISRTTKWAGKHLAATPVTVLDRE